MIILMCFGSNYLGYSQNNPPCNGNNPPEEITTNTTWNGLTKEYCPNQQLIVRAGKTLIVQNCTLKVNSNNSTGLWNGIILEAGASIYIVGSSVIRDCKTAVFGDNGFNKIHIAYSNILNVRTAVYGKRGVAIAGGPIYLDNVEIWNRSDGSQILIGGNGANVTCIKVTAHNLSQDLFNVGVDGFNNAVYIRDSKFLGFRRCINKGVGGAVPLQGLTILNSDIVSSEENDPNYLSLHNSDLVVTSKKNVFVGIAYNSGTMVSTWKSNNFINGYTYLGNPTASNRFEENRFVGKFQMDGNNSLTDAICNFWNHGGLAVDGQATPVLGDWCVRGSRGMCSDRSGNYHPQGLNPTMKNLVGAISNHFTIQQPQSFIYEGTFTGTNRGVNFDNQCQASWREYIVPIDLQSNDPLYNDYDNNSQWILYNGYYLDALSQYPTNDTVVNQALVQQMEGAQLFMGDCVVLALSNSNSLSPASATTWSNRAPAIFNIRAQIMSLYDSESFTDLSIYLNGLSLTGSVSTDRNNFKNAVNWMNQAKIDGKNLYELTQSDLNVLIGYANASWGDYTAVLRGWLSINYFIYVDPPVNNNLKADNISKIKPETAFKTNINIAYLGNCITVTDIQNEAVMEILNIEGTCLKKIKIRPYDQYCLDDNFNQGVYKIRITESNNTITRTLVKE